MAAQDGEQNMKIACLQFAPEVGKVQENVRRADAILQNTQIPTDLDWLVLPELAFSGYNFHSLEEIKPYLEPTTAGISTEWAIQVAQHSTVTVSPAGKILQNYRKSFLYYTDETWSSEGPGDHTHILSNATSPDHPFYSGPLGDLGDVTLGICMDINPYRFTAPWESYEFARTALTHKSSLLCISMAWLCHLTPDELVQEPTQPDIATIAYWVERFQPIVDSKSEKPVYIIMANRSGVEKGVCYAGSTTVIKIQAGVVSLFETCGKSEEKCLVVDLSEKPKFQVRSGQS
jgi:protein N-terminal amidase